MAERTHKQKQDTRTEQEEATQEFPVEGAEQADTEALDDFLDEIDGVLEENAAEFVANYVQKGGE